jgi:DNA-binding NtrC family response regulator
MKPADSISLFLVDDNILYQKSLEHYLLHSLKHTIHIRSFSSAEACLQHLSEKPDIVILDYLLADEHSTTTLTGMDVLDKIKQQYPDLTVILLSGHKEIETVVDLTRHGAAAYVIKNEHAFGRIHRLIQKAVATLSLKRQIRRYKTWGVTCFLILACIASAAMAIARFYHDWVHTF